MLARGERQPRNGKGGFKGQQAQSSDQPADDGLLRDTLRLTLQSHNMIRQALDSTTITVLIDKEETKSELANLMNQWFEQLPKRTDQMIKDRVFPEHPMKLQRKTLAVQYILRELSKAKVANQSEDEESSRRFKIFVRNIVFLKMGASGCGVSHLQ